MPTDLRHPMQHGLPPATRAVWLELDALPATARSHFGSWGDAAHQARKSCHNTGRAIDVSDSRPAALIAVRDWAIANHARLKIRRVIHNRLRASAGSGWKLVPYRGADPHLHHTHISIDCDL